MIIIMIRITVIKMGTVMIKDKETNTKINNNDDGNNTNKNNDK